MQSLASFWSLTATKPSHKATQPVKEHTFLLICSAHFSNWVLPQTNMMTINDATLHIMKKTNTTLSHPPNPQPLHLRHPSMHIRWSSPPAARNFSCSEVPLQRNPIWSHCEEWRPTPTSRRPVAPAANVLRPKLELKSLLRGSFDPGCGESFKTWRIRSQTDGEDQSEFYPMASYTSF